ncbi:unnamed protein product [Cladocopium goreaui]|uniref:Uncharacterized protein n=1 Tax=Cladocopium goreaui TaxID=2562237 RepID=A0A9P1BP61_9DINO|nr:unnamed protein product [Cladocopium goreaui]
MAGMAKYDRRQVGTVADPSAASASLALLGGDLLRGEPDPEGTKALEASGESAKNLTEGVGKAFVAFKAERCRSS